MHDRVARGNWGQWGEQDERRVSNFISPATVGEAVRLASSGRVCSLALPVRSSKVPVFPLTITGGVGSPLNPLAIAR